MSANIIESYVYAYIWLPRDEEGNACQEYIHGKNSKLGHVSLDIIEGGNKHYVSLLPTIEKDQKKQFGVLTGSLEYDQNTDGIKSAPDVMLRISGLNVPEMLTKLIALRYAVNTHQICWNYFSEDMTSLQNLDKEGPCASGASFVYSLLLAGGLGKLEPQTTGPKDIDFYRLTKCHAGETLFGKVSQLFFKPKNYLSPHDVLLRLASVAEKNNMDKLGTEAAMRSYPLANTKIYDDTPQKVGVIVAIAAAVFGVNAIKNNLKKGQ